jgi:protein-tyrosine-phosphatase
LYAKLGKLPHLQNDADFQATQRVLSKLGLDAVEIDRKTAQPYEEQFWEQYDLILDLNEEELKRELPVFITDPSN